MAGEQQPQEQKPLPEAVEGAEKPAQQPKPLTLPEQLGQAAREMRDAVQDVATSGSEKVGEKLAAAIAVLVDQLDELKPESAVQAARKGLEELGVVALGDQLKSIASAITTVPPTEQLRQLVEKAKSDPAAAATAMGEIADGIAVSAAAEGAKVAGVAPVATGIRRAGR